MTIDQKYFELDSWLVVIAAVVAAGETVETLQMRPDCPAESVN